jgi:hypothetical protein
MFVFGLFIGPVLGLLVGLFVLQSPAFGRGLGGLVAVLVLILLLFVAFLPLDLRLGAVTGYLLGLLVSMTPQTMTTDTV